MGPKKNLKRRLVSFGFLLCCYSSALLAEEALPRPFSFDIAGYAKSLNKFTRTSGVTPEAIHNPLALAEAKEDLFETLERVRLQMKAGVKLGLNQRLAAKIDYDHQTHFGSFVASGDFRYAKKLTEERQFLDLSQTLVEEDGGFYEHRLYRASLGYESPWGSLEIGRQQIPWGLGQFFTPTDLFNPFSPTQIEFDERDGVDAVNVQGRTFRGIKPQFVYTPRGRRLHPQRFLTRFSRDISGYELGLIGGAVKKDSVCGFDASGNVRDSAVRGEFLFREAREEKDFIQFTVNADYNFPYNIYALLEYYFNGQGRRHWRDYQRDRAIRGEINQLGKNYLALTLGRDLTSLLRVEHRTIFNLNDVSFFLRPEIQYELTSNLLATLAAQLFLGANQDEFGSPKNLFFGELKYSF